MSQTVRPRTRKRGRDDAATHPTTSSDPAWFSSDDDPSLDNYLQGRRKKRYAGSWFSQHQHASSADSTVSRVHVPSKPSKPSKPAKRTLQRQFDSGVWMGSDTTDLDDIPEELTTPTRPGFSLPRRTSKPLISYAEEAARSNIRQCLDNSEESIDLT